LLLASFIVYALWLFSKKERFAKSYDDNVVVPFNLKKFFGDLLIIFGGIVLLLIGGWGVVKSATFFAQTFHLPLGLIGMFVVAVGTCMPETFFSLHAARKGQYWLIFGNLMGSVVVTATLVLGIVAIIHPIHFDDFSPFAVARLFLLVSVICFFTFLKTDCLITKKEGLVLVGIYIAFLITQILTR
jgi:cation:H+ antiporter